MDITYGLDDILQDAGNPIFYRWMKYQGKDVRQYLFPDGIKKMLLTIENDDCIVSHEWRTGTMDYSNLIEQAARAISENHCVDTQETRLDSLVELYVPDCVDVESVLQHPEVQYIKAKENAYDSGYNYAKAMMQPMMEYTRSDQFSEDFEPATDDYDTVNSYFSDWLVECVDVSKQFSPWEFIADEINSFPDPDSTSDLWQAYDEGQALAIEEWVESNGLKNESALMDVLDDHEDKTLVVEYRLSNNCWEGLPIEDVFEARNIEAPDFITEPYLNQDMSWIKDLATCGCEGGLYLIYNAEILELAYKSRDLDDFLADNEWSPVGEDLTDVTIKAVWFAAQTWAMNVLSELELDY